MEMNSGAGSFVAVGLGMMLGAHVTPRARSEIENADVVFGLVSDAIVEMWLRDMRGDMRSLQSFYAEGKLRTESYREMIECMLLEVRAGRNVCGVFYGHPGVFSQVPHHAVRQARAEGYHAEMHAGISAEDCLYADLGIDPGIYGCQHYEASQLLLYRRMVDPSAYLVLWQIAVVGDMSITFRRATPRQLQLLLSLLEGYGYSADHESILYEAATLPISSPRIERIPLSALLEAELKLQSTLVIPPARRLVPNVEMRQALLDDRL